MKILHIITSLNQGGAEEMLFKTLEFHKISGGNTADILVLCLISKGVVGDKIEDMGFRVIYLDLKRIKNLFSNFFIAMRQVRKYKPDVMHCWMYHANIYSLFLKIFTGSAKIIWGIRQSLYDLKREKLLTRAIINLSAMISNKPDCIIYNSHLAKNQHERLGFSGKASTVISNGFFPDLFKPSKHIYSQLRSKYNLGESVKLVGIFARYHPLKNHTFFLKIAHLIKESFTGSVKFIMAGTNIDANNKELAKIIQAHSLENDVILLGRVDSKKYMPALDVLLSTSWGEAFSNSIAEGMLCGVPCVATDVGDSARVVGHNDFIFDVDDETGMSDMVIDILSISSEEYSKLSLNSRYHIKNNFSMEKYFNQ